MRPGRDKIFAMDGQDVAEECKGSDEPMMQGVECGATSRRTRPFAMAAWQTARLEGEIKFRDRFDDDRRQRDSKYEDAGWTG